MNAFRFLFLLMSLCLSRYVVTAQISPIDKVSDSLNAVILQDFNRKLSSIRQQQTEDSLGKVQLQARINALKTTDNLKKEELQQQLLELGTRDARRLAQRKVQIDSLRAPGYGHGVYG